MIGRTARYVWVLSALLGAGCTPELGDVPFACGTGGLCPEGYSCQATVCVRDGASPTSRRPKRVAWINPPEMFWLSAPGGGATLLVNDGFTPGARGIYEIHVAPDGNVSEPRAIYTYGGAVISSAVVPLPDGRYGVVLVRFPNVDSDETTLELLGIERTSASGSTPAVEKLFSTTTPFLGGVEPPYVGAAIDGTTLNIAWTVPSGGGRVEVLHLERQGSLWNPTWKASASLPPDVPPLSGDCQLFRDDGGVLTVRVGFESYALSTLDPATAMDGMVSMTTFAPTTDEPLFGWKDGVFAMRRGDYDPANAAFAVSYVFTPAMGMPTEDKGFTMPETTTPFVGTPFEGGALVAPVSRDPMLPTVDVAWRSPTEPLRIVASVPRTSTGSIFSSRAYGLGDKAYVAWTEFYESNMDLWIGVSDLRREGMGMLLGRASHVRGLSRPVGGPQVEKAEGQGAP
ncbi:hypothetical protein [Polyangium sorediatum]|uniref:Lipoprotein n=1 Tax=Polyangium sorediatum TaxID=889274 RepID=A0ABT6NM62_9BACT|nr:hypothetical protein [Polyangium sorediatum]MDI1429332.1 hypothetical protein [Polyangium sorediatum]